MKINNKEITLEQALGYVNNDNIILKRRDNGFLFSDFQISVLRKNGINYENYSNMQELLFDIEECLNNNYDDELDLVSSQIAELLYYKDTKKWDIKV